MPEQDDTAAGAGDAPPKAAESNDCPEELPGSVAEPAPADEVARAPTDAPYKVVPVPGKGLGVLSTRSLEPGELVLAERPMLEYEGLGPAWLAGAQQRFDLLRKPLQQEVLALQDAFAKSSGKKSLEGILRTNSLSRGMSSDGLLCKLSSRLNHSCVPNCDWCWDEETREVRIYASSAVAEGEELCIHYVELRAPKGARVKQLQDMYKFTCRCAACKLGGAALESSDRRRERMATLNQKLDAVGNKDAKLAIEMVDELMELYLEEGIHSKSFRKRACFYAYQFALVLCNFEAASFYVERAHEYSVLCHGTHHAQSRRLAKYVKNPRSHPAATRWMWEAGMTLVRLLALAIFSHSLWRSFGSGSWW